MKCAKEIVDIRSQANAVVEAQLTAQALATYTVACADAITLCEESISKALEESASHHGTEFVKISFPVYIYEDRLGNKLFKRVTETKKAYANGDSSWYHSGDPYSLKALTEYLEQFCYTVSIRECGFRCKSWGFGDTSFPVLEITARPECE